MYEAQETVRIQPLRYTGAAELEQAGEPEFHEMRSDGTSLCGVKTRPAGELTMWMTKQGPGTVTCGACATIAGH